MNWFKRFWKALNTRAPIAAAEEKSFHLVSGEEVYCNFTPRAQQVLGLARSEAHQFRHSFVGTEHLLLGLLALNHGVATNVLKKMGVDLQSARKEVLAVVATGPGQNEVGTATYTPRLKSVLALATQEARTLHHTYIGTEHLLLGIMREDKGAAAVVLKQLGVDIVRARQEILQELDPNFGLDA
jgi:ATP-dependent Clp protease ATP-binding subunit ClpC